jgi:tetratricopeptide (TPR) repeat protein
VARGFANLGDPRVTLVARHKAVAVVATGAAIALLAGAVGGGIAFQAGAQSASPEAQSLFEQARAALPDRDALQTLLDRAIALDPDFAAAYALKAETYAAAIAATVARSNDLAAAAALDELAVSNARKAIALDPKLDGAFTALGLAHRQFWRWGEALEAYRRALELEPDDPATLFNWIWLNSFARRHDEAIAAAERGVALYPASANAHRDLGLAHAYAGTPERASAELAQCAELDSRVTICHIYLALMQVRLGNPDVAAAELEKAEELAGAAATPATVSSLAHAYYRAGRSDDAARLYTRLEQQGTTGVVGAGSWPLGYLAIGDVQRAFGTLERAVAKIERHEPDEGFFNLMIIKANVGANPVLDEPRFRALRDKIGAL